ncbi:HAMP domain-containing protein, partial [Clostridium butyricum]
MKKFIDKPTYQAISNFKNGLSQNTVLYVRENESKNKLVCVTNIDNSKYLILTKNVKTIEDSVQIANEFYLIAGLIVFSAGSLFILFFSKKITKPIVEMSNVAENISNLEFDKIVHVNSQDEIGALGESINKISYKLNKSINELKRDVDRRKSFLRNISHELKTPIGIIKGYSEGLK